MLFEHPGSGEWCSKNYTKHSVQGECDAGTARPEGFTNIPAVKQYPKRRARSGQRSGKKQFGIKAILLPVPHWPLGASKARCSR